MSSQNIVNLEMNGRIFPLWIMKNFNKFVLPKIISQPGEDPCNEEKQGIQLYQSFIGNFINYQSPFKDILIYHGVGAGKTYSAINVYNILFNYTPKWNVFLLIPASLRDDPWMKDIEKYMTKTDYDLRFNNIIIIHYDSPIADKDFLDKIKKSDSSKMSIFIIDEAHKFINNVYNNISGKKGKRAQVIYDYILQENKENNNTRVMLLSATPVVNNPFEFALIFNLLRPGSFPMSESAFSQLFISATNFASLNENTKNMFQRRILGLVSYYIGATPDKYAKKMVHYVNIPMESYQEEIYNFYEAIEEKAEKQMLKYSRGKVGDKISTYSSYTRQSCNFVFPNISEIINGEKRPRPSHFKISEKEALIIDEGKNEKKKNKVIKSNEQALEYLKTVRIFVNSFIEYLKNISKTDKDHTLIDDIKSYLGNYGGNYHKFYSSEDKKSNLFKAMMISSPKYIRLIFNLLKIKGTILIYSNYVEMEGLQLLKVYLHFFKFIDIDDDKEFNKNELEPTKTLSKDYLRYCEFHGGINKEIRKINKHIFNMSNNKYGKYCKIIMISPAGAEGINLNNVRQVHILEPYWNEVRIEQVIGRALRYCQHKDLPLNERTVDVYRYKMIRNNKKITTDEKMEDISRKKNNLLLSFTEAVKEAAVDCELFKNHNMMGSKYRCFQFNENSLFDKVVGPAYQQKIEYDIKTNNGLNSIDSKISRIRVRKVKCVKKLSSGNLSEDNFYWLNDNNGVIYDLELHYPVGSLEKDENNNFVLLDNNIYIIGQLINVPTFNTLHT
jgi:superfamily II DNA or RNA helicase